ncbi:MAG: M20/M25/M40 family metallo-hydrolase, partial [Flavobacteriales bacterium]
AAISTVDANALSAAFKKSLHVEVSMNLNCELLSEKTQANVIAEITGSEFPDEYIVVGGHLDSWDIGEGAHDDGAGIVHSIEVLHLFKTLNIRPKHTIRIVLYINEENGNNGGKTYAAIAKEKGEVHVAALESDMGGFVPRGFSMEATDEQTETIRSWEKLFSDYNIHLFRRGWSGVDIRPLKNGETALVGLVPDNQRYFDFHHSANDVFENVHKRELELGAATMASFIYLLDLYF